MNHATSFREPQRLASSLVTPASAHPVLDAETQQFLDTVAEAGSHPDYLFLEHHVGSAPSPDSCEFGADHPVTTEDFTLEVGPTGLVAVRIVRPYGTSATLPAVLYFPGGGWRTGTRLTHDRLIRRLAALAEAAIVFVEYSRAPDVNYPTQNEQAYAVLTHIVEHAASLGIDARAIAVAGDGAGGNMAAVVALLAKSRVGPRIAFQALFCPIVSADSTTSSYAAFADGPGVTGDVVQALIHAQFPADRLDETTAMPLLASISELEGLPPALIITAENDVVRDEGEAYARKLMRAGVRVSATRYLGTIHDFVVFDGLADTFPADTAIRQASAALKEVLRP